MISSGINLVMTVIGFSVSIMFIVFVCTRLVCARFQLNASRRSFSFPIASSILDRASNGLEPVVVAKFPIKKYTDDSFLTAEDAQCPICLAEFLGEDMLRILPYCGHSFHVTCVDKWLQQHTTCPVCRITLREHPDCKHAVRTMFSSAFQSHYNVESFDTDSHNCIETGTGFPVRTSGNRGMNPIQEDHFAPEVDRSEAGVSVFPLSEGNERMKDSGTKLVESPSNP
ncbi:hypothetical protein F2P56_031901 [Juglans regia]|uniref:RING-type domain-containing protein n=2 Tax=Juglans regia TaxID=51240 RepID=A0A833TWV5_JUGRE|nr:RING-H2 finger protein ATL8-like [Juglans regia]KAF5446263.1 hypothetical protein F2P56_031901 [Juglans regia]